MKQKSIFAFVGLFIILGLLFFSYRGGLFDTLLSSGTTPEQTEVPPTVADKGAAPSSDSTTAEAKQLLKISSIKSLVASIRAYAEIYHDAQNFSYKDFCLSKEKIAAEASIKKIDGGGALNCVDSKETYRIFTLLPDKTTLCIDSEGRSLIGQAPNAGSFVCGE